MLCACVCVFVCMMRMRAPASQMHTLPCIAAVMFLLCVRACVCVRVCVCVCVCVRLNQTQQNNVAQGNIANLTIRLFLAIYNCEMHRVNVVTMLLQNAQIPNHTEMLFHILGHIGTNITTENIMFDLCLVLQSMSIPQYASLCTKVENYVQDRQVATSLMSSSQWPRQCRVSLRKVLEGLKHDHRTTASPESEYVLPDMPIHAVAWASKSSTEQKVTLLIMSIRPEYLPHKFEFITSLFGSIVTKEVDLYTVKHTRIQGIISTTVCLLQKLSNNIDMANTTLLLLINRFVEECFSGIFGQVHRTLMTLSFFTQMYVIAYLEMPMRLKFYQHIVETFNRRLETSNKELTLSCNIPHNLEANMEFWAKNNQFSTAGFEYVLKAMCI